MRAIFGVILVVLAPTVAWADGAYRAPAGPAPESLPPGLWFRENHYEDHVLEEEPAQAPRVAVIAGTFGGDGAATRAAARIDRTRVSLGFPWVVANHDLRLAGRCRDGAVVVVGLFLSEGDARAWQGADPSRRGLRVARLETPEDERRCEWRYAEDGEVDAAGVRLEVVQVDPGRDAAAISVADLERLQREQEVRSVSSEEREQWIERMPATCAVARGSVHVFRGSRVMHRFGWRFAPVRCGGRVAYVPVERSFRGIVIERRSSGESRLHQITDVTCDMASFDVWRYTTEGRIVIPEQPPTFTAWCGAS